MVAFKYSTKASSLLSTSLWNPMLQLFVICFQSAVVGVCGLFASNRNDQGGKGGPMTDGVACWAL